MLDGGHNFGIMNIPCLKTSLNQVTTHIITICQKTKLLRIITLCFLLKVSFAAKIFTPTLYSQGNFFFFDNSVHNSLQLFLAKRRAKLVYNLVAREARAQCVSRVWVLASCKLAAGGGGEATSHTFC